MVMEKGGWAYGEAEIDAVTYPLWVPGRYYRSTPSIYLATATNHDQMFAVPIYAPGPNGYNVDELGLELTLTGSSSGLIRLGIYDDLDGSPWDLNLDAGTIDTGHSGWQHVDVAVRLRGWAWLAAAFDDYAQDPTYRAFYIALAGLGFGRPGTLPYSNGYIVEGSRAVVQAGLPARFPMNASAVVAPVSQAYMPNLMVRAV